jgi:hypothetical protein
MEIMINFPKGLMMAILNAMHWQKDFYLEILMDLH